MSITIDKKWYILVKVERREVLFKIKIEEQKIPYKLQLGSFQVIYENED